MGALQEQLLDRMGELEARVVTLAQEVHAGRKRIDALESQLSDAAAASPAPETAPMPPRPAPEAPMADAAEIYRQAFSDYALRRYEESAAGFLDFLSLYPTHEHAASARFFAAESLQAAGRYQEAVGQYLLLTEEHSRDARIPEALAHLAEALDALGRPQEAAEVRSALEEQYPGSSSDPGNATSTGGRL